MHIPINVEELNKCLKIARSTPSTTDMILASMAKSQLISKYPIVQDIEKNYAASSICILAGWCAIGFKLLFTRPYTITSIDVDSRCELIGSRIFDDVTFITDDLCDYIPNTDIVINTSTEHTEHTRLFTAFSNIASGTVCYFQNNNMNWMEGHINCFDTLSDFCSYLEAHFTLISFNEIKIVKPRYTGIRYNVKCVKK